jgi:ABC-type antimicrobial peptide transport system permease subunit
VLGYLVEQRTREIAIRRAVGAQSGDVIHLIGGEGMRLVAAGLALGLLGALGAARLLVGLLYGIGPWDVVAYLGALCVLGLGALPAMLVPAIRAAAIAPVSALQEG